jgi:transposase
MEIKLRERMGIPWPRILGVDEHRFKRGKTGFAEFVTVLTDVGRKRIFDLAETKNTQELVRQLDHIPGRERVEIVTLDLSRGYRSFVQNLFPQARLVADKFHVLRLITPAIIRERKNIHGHRQELRIRRQLLRSREKLDYFERSDLDHYLKQHPKLDELYRYKERLHQLYRTKGYNRARWALDGLLEQMRTSQLEEIQRLRRTLTQWKEEVLEYFRARYTNAFTEAMNSIAKLVQRRGCGYRNFENYRLRTLSACPT